MMTTTATAIPAALLAAWLACGARPAAAEAEAPAPAPPCPSLPCFYPDDPLAIEPETQDASQAVEDDVGMLWDVVSNLFAPRRPGGPVAGDVNSIDEVPDSSWFTNRIGSRPLTAAEIERGATRGPAPAAGTWIITAPKTAGAAPGFTALDSGGESWFVSFDPPSSPEAATGALAAASRFFWALGYNQTEVYITRLRREDLVIGREATMPRPSGKRTAMDRHDLDEVLRRAARSADGSYRAAVSRRLPGRVLGGSWYHGTRPDDPNDVIPHEDRRSLRALRVFGAWLNLVDWKASNALDTVITVGGQSRVVHYLQDVGSTFGIGARGPREWSEGWEFLADGGPMLKRTATLGLALSPWQTVDYEELPAVGRFEGTRFDPTTWKPRVPTRAYFRMREDDAFWAARRVMAFDEAAIAAALRAAAYSDPRAAALIARVLGERRLAIGRAYLLALNPIADPALAADGRLRFGNAAVEHGLAPAPPGYRGVWSALDNATGTLTPLGVSEAPGTELAAPGPLPAGAGALVQVELAVVGGQRPEWRQPVVAHFRRRGDGTFQWVGFRRQPR